MVAAKWVFLRPGHGPPATGYRLPATGYRLQATGHRLPATGYRLRATGYRPRPQVTGYRLRATGYGLQARPGPRPAEAGRPGASGRGPVLAAGGGEGVDVGQRHLRLKDVRGADDQPAAAPVVVDHLLHPPATMSSAWTRRPCSGIGRRRQLATPRSAKEHYEARLSEMAVPSQGLDDPALAHDLEGYAVRQRPVLVRAVSVQL